MAGPIFLLDFRRGTVEAIDEAVPPSGVRDPFIHRRARAAVRGIRICAGGARHPASCTGMQFSRVAGPADACPARRCW